MASCLNDTVQTFCIAGEGLSDMSIKVQWRNEYAMKSHPLHKGIDEIWEKRTKECVNLYNASKFRFHRVDVAQHSPDILPEVTFFLGPTDYKEFIGTNCAPYAQQLVEDGIANYNNPQAYLGNPLGVGALLETDDSDFIFIRRSNTCAEMQGMIDRPGGHPEPEEVIKNTNHSVDLVEPSKIVEEIYESVLKEIRDEINIPIENLTSPILLGISYNPVTWRRPSLEFYVRCKLKTVQVQEKYLEQTQAESEESTELVVLPLSELLAVETLKSVQVFNELTHAAQSAILLLNVFLSKENGSK